MKEERERDRDRDRDRDRERAPLNPIRKAVNGCHGRFAYVQCSTSFKRSGSFTSYIIYVCKIQFSRTLCPH